jgi:uncharacterized protein (DUF2141 family)
MFLRYRLVYLVAIVIFCLYTLNTRLVEKRNPQRKLETPLSLNHESRQPAESAAKMKDNQDDSVVDAAHDAPPEEAADQSSVETLSEEFQFTLKISGLKPQESKLYIALFNSADGFPKGDQSWKTEVTSVKDSTVTHQFACEKVDQLAVAVFQDLDGNGVLSKGDFGIPSEPYGFSNNARGLMGPPTFKQSQIKIDHAETILEIHLK